MRTHEPGRPTLAPRDLLLLAVWLGAYAGVAELAAKYARKRFEDGYLFAGLDLVWMLPVVDIVPVLGMAAAVLGLTLLRPTLISRRLALGALTATAAFTALYFLVPRIHVLAAGVLALGLAVPSSAVMDRRFPAVRRLAGWMVAGLAVLIASATAGIHGAQVLAERRAAARLPALPTGTPNVLLLVIDTERSLSMSLYGHSRATTPELERIAPAATVFDFAVAPAPWTLPSHASMFTGRLPHETVRGWVSPMNRRWPTLAEVLGARGWLGAGFVANREFVSREFGLHRGFSRFDDFPNDVGMMLDAAALMRTLTVRVRTALHNDDRLSRRSATDINARFLAWQRRHADRPFFAFLNYYEPHEPYLPHEPFASRFAVPPRRVRQAQALLRTSPPDRIPADIVAAEQLAYDATLAEADAAVGALLDSLERRGILDNTLLIVTSDHGEEFGQHGVFFHGHSLYLPVLRVPLLVRFPGRVPAGVRVTHPVSLRDIPATVLDLLNLPDAALPGASLARWWAPDASLRPASDTIVAEVDFLHQVPPWIPSNKGDMRSALTARHHYIVNGDGRPELYDIVADPLERRDLAADTAYAPVIRALHARLVAEGALRR